MQISIAAPCTFQLKGGLYTLTTLKLLSCDLAMLKEQLHDKVQQAPNFFKSAPIVLDFKQVNQLEVNIDFLELKQILLDCHLIPVGVKYPNAKQRLDAQSAGFAILQDTPATKSSPEKVIKPPDESHKSVSQVSSKVITQPVRSGQQVYAPQGDLIVLSTVGHGAELLADGHIHVYGALKGRALAGINGNKEARIFCQSLEAELVSIAGHYMMSEDIEQLAWKQPVEIMYQDGSLHINGLVYHLK